LFGRPDFDSRWWPGGSYTAEDAPDEFQTTQGRAIDHLAFSYRDIAPVFERMKSAGVEIVEPPAVREGVGHKSFFVMGPDKVLIEIVEAKPIPDSSWE
jgi:catechol 2,3-dioxygenase-like lactoylglutathione lyase family enzyme